MCLRGQSHLYIGEGDNDLAKPRVQFYRDLDWNRVGGARLPEGNDLGAGGEVTDRGAANNVASDERSRERHGPVLCEERSDGLEMCSDISIHESLAHSHLMSRRSQQ